MRYFPLFLDIKGKPVLLVGGQFNPAASMRCTWAAERWLRASFIC